MDNNNLFIVNQAQHENSIINYSFNIPKDAYYIIYFYGDYSLEDIGTIYTYSNIQLEQNNTATNFTPYFNIPDNTILYTYGKNLANIEKMKDSNNWFDGDYSYYPIYVGVDTTVNVSIRNPISTTSSSLYLTIGYSDETKGVQTGKWMYHATVNQLRHTSVNVTSTNGYIYINCGNYTANKTIVDNQFLDNYLQIEIGNQRTEYEPYSPYSDWYLLNNNKTLELESIYPNMSIITNTTYIDDLSKINLEIKYNKDINKAYNELKQAIITLGGTI